MKMILNKDYKYYLESKQEAEELKAQIRYRLKNIRQASKVLGINEKTLHCKLKWPKPEEKQQFFTYSEVNKLKESGIEIKVH